MCRLAANPNFTPKGASICAGSMAIKHETTTLLLAPSYGACGVFSVWMAEAERESPLKWAWLILVARKPRRERLGYAKSS